MGLTNQLRKKGVAEKTREMSRGRQAGIPEGELVKRSGRDAGYRATEEDAEFNDSRKNQKKKNDKERRGVTLNDH